MMDDIQTWWEIPSIVHFCKVFSPFCEDICPIDITEFELAVEENSDLLANMAVRFIKICGFYDPNTYKWWGIMKEHFQNRCIDYNFKYSLGSVTHFEDLTRKQKIEALYILCHLVLDDEEIQYKISVSPKLWNTLNVKPLGYDLNNSIYWYFGTTRLYREDFEKTLDLSANSSVFLNTTYHNTSNNSDSSSIDFQLNEPRPTGIVGLGKWNMICDGTNDSWYSFADTIGYSKNGNIRALHKSICSIIKQLPQVKRNKSHYKYLKTTTSHLRLKNNRILRSVFINDENSELLTNSYTSNQKQCSQNLKVNQFKHDDSLINKTKCNKNLIYGVQDKSHSAIIYNDDNKQIKNVKSETTAVKLQLRNGNTNINHSTNLKNVIDLPKAYQDCLKREAQVNLKGYDQENT